MTPCVQLPRTRAADAHEQPRTSTDDERVVAIWVARSGPGHPPGTGGQAHTQQRRSESPPARSSSTESAGRVIRSSR